MRVSRKLRGVNEWPERTPENRMSPSACETVRKARILAARRSTSISGLLAGEIERLVGDEEAWERSERSARALLEQGFHLGGLITASRDELHER
jgi:hypothetical protein